MKILKAISVVIFALNLFAPEVMADSDHGHSHGHATAPAMAVPETREALWKVIQDEHSALSAAVEKKSSEEAHHAEEKLQAYFQALIPMLSGFESSLRQRIEGQIRNLIRVYGNIHHATDDQLWDKAASEMKKADGGMKLLSAQMPE